MIAQFIAAFFGTVAFSLLFHVPKQYYPTCGFIGGCGWIFYVLLKPHLSIAMTCFFATSLVILISRFFAIRQKCPVTLFLVSGIFPLVPGSGVYWTAYYIIMDELPRALDKGYETLKISISIVLGIIFVFEIPQNVFHIGKRWSKEKQINKNKNNQKKL